MIKTGLVVLFVATALIVLLAINDSKKYNDTYSTCMQDFDKEYLCRAIARTVVR